MKNSSTKIWNNVRREIDRSKNMSETQLNIRLNRQGYRGMGMYQLIRYSSDEGVFVVGVGGPPVVGR